MNEALVGHEHRPTRTDWDILCSVKEPAKHGARFVALLLLCFGVNLLFVVCWCWAKAYTIANWPYLLIDLACMTTFYGTGLFFGFWYAHITCVGSPPEKYINDGAA